MLCPIHTPAPANIPERTLTEASKIYDIFMRCLQLFIDKNIDYGSSWRTCGLPGVIVRLLDKLQRAANLSKDGTSLRVRTESLGDTLIDIINYAAMSILLLEEAEHGMQDTKFKNS